jgi:hypothetical protein
LSSERPLVLAAVALALALPLACADLERGPRPVAPEAGAADGRGDGAGGSSFATVRPLLARDCAGCHAAGREAGTSGFVLGDDPAADHRSTRAFVEPANARASRLLDKAAGQGHGGGVVWTPRSSEYAAVLAWITAGAPP